MRTGITTDMACYIIYANNFPPSFSREFIHVYARGEGTGGENKRREEDGRERILREKLHIEIVFWQHKFG